MPTTLILAPADCQTFLRTFTALRYNQAGVRLKCRFYAVTGPCNVLHFSHRKKSCNLSAEALSGRHHQSFSFPNFFSMFLNPKYFFPIRIPIVLKIRSEKPPGIS